MRPHLIVFFFTSSIPIQMIMSDITSVSVTVTDQSGDDLCDDGACNSSPCLNGASCSTTSTAGYECACLPGYEGVNCELDVDECNQGES